MSLARENGLSPKMAETTYRAMVRSFIDYEQEILPLRLRRGRLVEEVRCEIPWRAKLLISMGRTFRGGAKFFPPRKQRIHHRL